MWNSKQTQVKAKAGAVRAGSGALAGGGLAYAILAFLRSRGNLPWDPETDAAIATVLATIGGSVWAWIRTYSTDRRKHGGGGYNTLPIVAIVAFGLVLGGCQTLHREVLPDGTVIETRGYDYEMTVVAIQTTVTVIEMLERSLETWYERELERGRLSAEEREIERERREQTIDQWVQRLERLMLLAAKLEPEPQNG